MPPKTCRVTVTDIKGVVHAVNVTAESLFEAGAMALGVLKKDGWTDPIGPGTKLQVQVQEPVVTHSLTVMQLERWLQGASSSPNETVRKKRLRQMLTGG